jgi:hypothetical protein
VITGKVITADGKPANDGAMERQWGETDLEFGPAGRIDPGGTFRWVTMEEGDVTLRAWPWKSPPSNAVKFACKSGARFPNITLTVQNKSPDISGILVDHEGQPVPFTFVDLAPLDPGGMGQQERTDATGHWQVFAMPAGRYRFTAQSPDRGVASLEVRSPQTDAKVVLGGLGRIEGTASRIANGSFEMSFEACNDDTSSIHLENQRRIVSVRDGHFAIADVPACSSLQYRAIWRGDDLRAGEVAVPSGAIATMDLPLGPAMDKTVHGHVYQNGKPVVGAVVTGQYKTDVTGTATTGPDGAFSISTKQGGRITAGKDAATAIADVSDSDARDEELDLQMVDSNEGRGDSFEFEGDDVPAPDEQETNTDDPAPPPPPTVPAPEINLQ